MNIREGMEERELSLLSPYAAHSGRSRGRERPEEECDVRTVYQRDRDRILHSKAFRRLKDKTQVFLAPQGDHYRNRLTHTLEVSQIARTIAKALRLNEDLVEAIALGHDLGHTPFGHAGERALNDVHPEGFSHYRQSVRVVELLEKDGQGLNLTWETRDGIQNHRTSGHPATLEGQVVRFSDKIAYIHHDMDDAQRAGIITEDHIPITLRMFLGYTTRERLNTFVHNIIETSMDQPEIRMSPPVQEALMELRRIMFQNVYLNPVAKREEKKAIRMLKKLYQHYIENPGDMSREYRELIREEKATVPQAVTDYISGMTDQYSMEKFKEIYIPRAWEVY
ncbi:MAG: deoxyguanosinetriphosphate triphosphohydrolase [Eubacteriales bacterium]|nr:deoxyguanosinetriphosphate triphosphohydrolase [Eubacteriales bacterium]